MRRNRMVHSWQSAKRRVLLVPKLHAVYTYYNRRGMRLCKRHYAKLCTRLMQEIRLDAYGPSYAAELARKRTPIPQSPSPRERGFLNKENGEPGDTLGPRQGSAHHPLHSRL